MVAGGSAVLLWKDTLSSNMLQGREATLELKGPTDLESYTQVPEKAHTI